MVKRSHVGPHNADEYTISSVKAGQDRMIPYTCLQVMHADKLHNKEKATALPLSDSEAPSLRKSLSITSLR